LNLVHARRTPSKASSGALVGFWGGLAESLLDAVVALISEGELLNEHHYAGGSGFGIMACNRAWLSD
jgi:hypothetical protein